MSFPPDHLHSLLFTKVIFSLEPYGEDWWCQKKKNNNKSIRNRNHLQSKKSIKGGLWAIACQLIANEGGEVMWILQSLKGLLLYIQHIDLWVISKTISKIFTVDSNDQAAGPSKDANKASP